VAGGVGERSGWTRFASEVLTVVLCAGSAYYFIAQTRTWPAAFLDSGIYREAAQALLSGDDVYAGKFGPPGLPFTYPPFALLVFVPMVALSSSLASVFVFGVSVLALVACVRWSQNYAAGGRTGSWWLTLALSACATVLVEPVRSTLTLGQVNLLLLALVLGLDARGGTRTGWGAGIAAAVKITPALLVVAQAARGEVRSFGRGVAAFALATGLAATVAPSATRQYFTNLLWDESRPGNLYYIGNQSLRGVWERHLPEAGLICWGATCVAALVLGAWCVRRHRRDAWFSLTLAAVVALLLSPVSWSHHWVWVIPCLAVGARHGWRRPVAWASILMLASTLIEAVLWTQPAPPLWSQDMFVLSGIAFLASAALMVPNDEEDAKAAEERLPRPAYFAE
jgi:alpha-1,2-mannosyltransferase